MITRPQKNTGFQLDKDMFENCTIHKNTDQNVIVVTEDKLWKCLRMHQDTLKAKTEWIAPAGIVATLITTFFATNFNTFIFDASVWKALYVMAIIISSVYLIRNSWTAYANRKEGNIESIIETLKAENINKA